ncbi:MAG: helix-turn-helix domain-containing protein [Clostridia bacterium]|nr:helix-turn-helix domain-containing protein [Clostridia bacterium]
MKDYMTIEETCDYFKVSANTLKSWREKGLTIIKIGNKILFSAQDLNDFLDQFKFGGIR